MKKLENSEQQWNTTENHNHNLCMWLQSIHSGGMRKMSETYIYIH